VIARQNNDLIVCRLCRAKCFDQFLESFIASIVVSVGNVSGRDYGVQTTAIFDKVFAEPLERKL
jgi:hypothetical protein